VICIFHMSSQTTSTSIQPVTMPGIFVPVSSYLQRTPSSPHEARSTSRLSPPCQTPIEPAGRQRSTTTSMAVDPRQPRNGISSPTRLSPYSRIPQRRVVTHESLNASKTRKFFDATKPKSLTRTTSSSSSVETSSSTSFSSVSHQLTQASLHAFAPFCLHLLTATPEAKVTNTTIT